MTSEIFRCSDHEFHMNEFGCKILTILLDADTDRKRGLDGDSYEETKFRKNCRVLDLYLEEER